MTPEEMKRRIRAFALRCIKLATSFPRGALGDTFRWQLIKAGSSAAANYRAACVGRSRADFISKLGIVEEETDESVFWIDFSAEAGLVNPDRVQDLIREGQEILAMIVSSRKTAKGRGARPKA